MEHDMEKQVKRLARKLRDEGVAPERDLWPGIEGALDRAGPRERPRQIFNASARWRLAAVAATLVLLLGSGYFGSDSSGPIPGEEVALMELPNESGSQIAASEYSPLRCLNNTISELAAAMALDPDNIKLTRLSLLVHKSRANLLRVGTRL